MVRLEETLCGLKEQFQRLQLTDVDNDQARQRALYKGVQKVRHATLSTIPGRMLRTSRVRQIVSQAPRSRNPTYLRVIPL